jgi:hypothetical protein
MKAAHRIAIKQNVQSDIRIDFAANPKIMHATL